MKKIMFLLQLAFVFSMANSVFGEVYAYDTFTYEPGGIFEQDAPTYGFAGSWDGGGGNVAQCTVEPGSLAYAGVDTVLQQNSEKLQVIVPVFDGGRIGRFLDTDGNFSEYRTSQGAIGNPGQTIYLSFLMKTNYTSPFFAFELKRGGLGDNEGMLYIGNDIGGDRIQVCAFRDRNQDPVNIGVNLQFLGDATTNTELYVVRIDFEADGDNVTVYRDPSFDAEPVKDPDLETFGDISFDAITVAAWVGPNGRTAQFDEICIASSYKDAVRFYNSPERANTPLPTDGSTDDVNASQPVTLSWTAGTGVSVANYKVYVSNILDDVISASPSALKDTTTSASIEVDGLDTDSTYYWSVTESQVADDPNFDIPGVIWTFETNKTYPEVLSQPVSQEVFAGENVSFVFDVTSQSPESYQWYDLGGMIVDGGNVSGANTAELIITGAQIANENEFYCEVTNTAGTITSDTVGLMIKRLVGYWDLDYPGTADPNFLWLDLSDSNNDLTAAFTVPESFEWTDGADGSADGALLMDGKFGLGTKKADGTMNDIPVANEPYSVSLWFKGGLQAGGVGLLGWGNYGNFNQVNAFGIWDGAPNRVQNYWWDNDINADVSYSLQDDSWHHVVSTYDGSIRTMYVDGIQVVSDNPIAHNVQTSENFMIGKTNMTADVTEFVGAMDDVKVFNYALTATDVAQSYTTITGGDICVVNLEYDFNNNCKVDLEDFSMFLAEWLDCGLFPTCTTIVE